MLFVIVGESVGVLGVEVYLVVPDVEALGGDTGKGVEVPFGA